MTNAPLVARKLAVLADHLARLRARRPADLASYRADTMLQDAVALSILVVVQEAMDISLHIASDEGWEVATTFRDAFDVLAKHSVITSELAARLGATVQLRNRIAHGYATVDAERVWTELPSGIETFDAFSTAVAAFLVKST